MRAGIFATRALVLADADVNITGPMVSVSIQRTSNNDTVTLRVTMLPVTDQNVVAPVVGLFPRARLRVKNLQVLGINPDPQIPETELALLRKVMGYQQPQKHPL